MDQLSEPTAVRLDTLDFMRGIAVLGIFVINIESFAFANSFNPWQYGFDTDLDRDFRFWTYFFFQGKFFSMFALLFGVGFYLFLERVARYGQHAVDLYGQRMFWLFVFGVLHACLLWPGDILYHYAICGLLLLPARSLRLWQLSACVLVLMALIGGQSISSTSQRLEQKAGYEDAVAIPVAQRSEEQSNTVERWERQHSRRSAAMPDTDSPRLRGYLSNVAANIEAVNVADGHIFHRNILFRTLLLMLVGILLYRVGVFRDYQVLKGYRFMSVGVLVLGLVANYSRHWSWTYEYFNPITSYPIALLHHFSKEILGVAYVLILNGLFQRYLGGLTFNPLLSVGRMALTNYLFQSVLAGFIFYGYGLGWYGSLGRSELWPIVLAVWAVQLLLSVAWLNYFRQGPMEALWRRLVWSIAMPRSTQWSPDTPPPGPIPPPR